MTTVSEWCVERRISILAGDAARRVAEQEAGGPLAEDFRCAVITVDDKASFVLSGASLEWLIAYLIKTRDGIALDCNPMVIEWGIFRDVVLAADQTPDGER